MVVEAISDFLTPEFIRLASQELRTVGFLSDEHRFAPYRETISRYAPDIERAVNGAGLAVSLHSGFVKNHPDAGYSYFIYDKGRFNDPAEAERAVSAWLDRKYAPGV